MSNSVKSLLKHKLDVVSQLLIESKAENLLALDEYLLTIDEASVAIVAIINDAKNAINASVQ